VTQSLGRAPNPSELARHLGIPTEDVLDGLQACEAYRTDSLGGEPLIEHPGQGQRALGDRLAENDRAFELTVDLLALRPLLAQLPSRERNILLMRFYGEPVGGVARHA
jgi:RNA polymerase sigma-B factor